MYLRLHVADESSTIAFSNKFGAEPEGAIDLLKAAKEFGLNPIGLTFHVGSQATSSNVWHTALETCSEVISQAKKINVEIGLVNLGGGFPVQYTQNDPAIDQVSKEVNLAVKNHIPHIKHIIAEPGRYIVADSSVIITTIIGVEERNGKDWLYLDVGTFQAFVEIFEFGYFPYPVKSLKHEVNKFPARELKSYALTGPSCDSYDTMTMDIKLPTDLAIGDKLIIGVTGAYTIVYGSNFNGYKIPTVKFIKPKN